MSKRRHDNEDTRVSKFKKHNSQTPVSVPADQIGVWRFGEDECFTSVKKKWSVSHCITYLINKLEEADDCDCSDLDLWVKNRCIMLDKDDSLSDYPGLTKLYIVQRPESRDAPTKYQTTDDDVIDPYSDDMCVLMTCGHATSPDNLYAYAWNQINNGAIEVRCPAIPDDHRPTDQCASLWTFKAICARACLSNDEINLFLSKLFSNWLERHKNVYLCPSCDEAQDDSCGRSVVKCRYCGHSFCVRCLRFVDENEKTCTSSECKQSIPKIRSLLRNCSMRTLVGVPNCPSVRACPVCQCVIEYDEIDSCKHMTCPRNTCQTKFCFICLKVKTDKYYWPCGGAYEKCVPAGRQMI
ncbi:E3 ubiquitin-protein ligase RNF19A-like [Pecten maximus]|uniref:E3 ubiquitin-protein ligase RNF19A-like n=1 Tax=Pecten maximus TaxID=6579 RepID=UPI001458A884|nr:E3 ubiquitin-protein ligase RNF19A-like [Pecten maximus]